MYSEQNEEVARRAYDLYAKTIPRCPLGNCTQANTESATW